MPNLLKTLLITEQYREKGAFWRPRNDMAVEELEAKISREESADILQQHCLCQDKTMQLRFGLEPTFF